VGFEQIYFYKYLISLSWLGITGLIFVTVFLTFTYISRVKELLDKRQKSKRFMVVVTGLVFIGVIFIYLDMFLSAYPDWITDSGLCRGKVESIYYNNNIYSLQLQCGEERKVFNLFQKEITNMHVGDELEISYLKERNQIYKCKILTEQDVGNI